MPRNPAGPSTLRNRNRVTNKTRLKVIKESIDADPIVLDEDEEKARVVSTAGVDAEDANVGLFRRFSSTGATMLKGRVWPTLIGWDRWSFLSMEWLTKTTYLGTSLASRPLRSGYSTPEYCEINASCTRQRFIAACSIHPHTRQYRYCSGL